MKVKDPRTGLLSGKSGT